MRFRLISAARPLTARAASSIYRRNASKAAQSPRVRKASRTHSGPPPSTPSPHIWPGSLLDDAFKSGLIPLGSHRAATFLSAFFALNGGRPTKNSAERLLKDFDLEPRTLFWLGWILQDRISVDASMKPLVKTLHTTAALLEDGNASLILVESALRAGQLDHPDLQTAERTLVQMSSNGHVHATERLAALYERRGEQSEALRMAEDIMKNGSSRDSKEAQILSPQFSCWRTVAKIRYALNDINGEIEAIEYGAKVMDDPEAYCELATKHISLSSRRRLECLLKAAASGVGRASFLVGERYYSQATGGSLEALIKPGTSSIDALEAKGSLFDRFQLKIAGHWFKAALTAKEGSLAYDREAAGVAAVICLAGAGNVLEARNLVAEHGKGMQFSRRFVAF